MKELPSRSTRGKRMKELIGDEKELDGAFWAQEIFKEARSDDEYEEESEKEDRFDDDFFKGESESDQEEQKVLPEEDKKKGKIRSKKVQKKTIKFKRVEGITQKEMLEQAAIVEMYNAHDLTKLLRNEENSKNSVVCKKDRGPVTWRLKEIAKAGKRKTTIWHTQPLESFFRSKPIKRICAVTGAYAKYKDPLTGKFYANREAFKVIRSQFYSEQEAEMLEHIKKLEGQLSNLL
jgi:hypothetical protein